MSDAMIPDEDAYEQSQSLTDEDEAPAAVDVLAEEGVPEDSTEADALDQAQTVSDDDQSGDGV